MFKNKKSPEKNDKGRLVCLYTLYDEIAEDAGPIFEAVNDAVAVRNVQNMMLKNQFIKISDFSLFRVAQVNKKSMEFEIIMCEKIEIPEVDVELQEKIKAFGQLKKEKKDDCK